ncbi:hypothetical protein BsWGS_08740 [Bradybaena similaris]
MATSGSRHLSFVVVCVVVAIAIVTPLAAGYKHVVFMHGLFAGPSEFSYFNGLIQKLHPGTPTTMVESFVKLKSLTRLKTQVKQITAELLPVLTNKSSDGTILICYSQGGMICRWLLASIEHNVDTFISLSAPLAGQYGVTGYIKQWFPDLTKDHAYKWMYTSLGQIVSVANYWNDPHQQNLFEKFSDFLAVLNNQSTTVNPRSQEFRNNFLRIKNLVLVGGPDDQVITPWQSSQFGMYNASEIVLPMEEQKWFQNDAFGLRTLTARGGVHTHTFKGIGHNGWHADDGVFATCIKPWLT